MSEKKFTKAMVLAVGGLGLISTILLLNDPPAASELEITPVIFETNSTKISQFEQRNIASATSPADPATNNLIELKCEEEGQVFETALIRLRLKGDKCLTEKSTSTRVKNTSNGYIATVFHRPDYSFTTDYINLSEGKNEIDVSFETADGTVTKKVTVNRSFQSAKK